MSCGSLATLGLGRRNSGKHNSSFPKILDSDHFGHGTTWTSDRHDIASLSPPFEASVLSCVTRCALLGPRALGRIPLHWPLTLYLCLMGAQPTQHYEHRYMNKNTMTIRPRQTSSLYMQLNESFCFFFFFCGLRAKGKWS